MSDDTATQRKAWQIVPLDPLIFRDGRPFGPTPGARSQSLPFPFPSTTAGGVRTQAMTNEQGTFDLRANNEQEKQERLKQLKAVQVYGPLLLETARDGMTQALLYPAPLDALLIKSDKELVTIHQLVPLASDEIWTDLVQAQPDASSLDQLYLVGPANPQQGKPASGAPRYWYEKQFFDWLKNPETVQENIEDTRQLGHNGPVQEQRVHLGMDSEKRTGLSGALFDTLGMEFVCQRPFQSVNKETGKEEWPTYPAHLSLALEVEDRAGIQMHEGLNSFGGERRMVQWKQSAVSFPRACPQELLEMMLGAGHCRLILLTPGHFEDLLHPSIFSKDIEHPIKLKAFATQRPQIVSGYDIALRQPKRTRRLAPAGTVFYLDLRLEEMGVGKRNTKKQVTEWIDKIWMHNISDGEQERLDGFGLAVLGTWSGTPAVMKIDKKEQQ